MNEEPVNALDQAASHRDWMRPSDVARKSPVLPALLFSIPLALVQIILAALALNIGVTVWCLGMAVCYTLVGGLCAYWTTRNQDNASSTKRGQRSGLLAGLFGSLLVLVILIVLLVWYSIWIIPNLSTQSSSGHVSPLSYASPQMRAQLGLFYFLFVYGPIFLLGNGCFVLLALLGGTLVDSLRRRQ